MAAHSRLKLTGISKELGGRTIVSDLDLEINPGELVCLLGPSGCGKTTTLRMIGGFLAPDRGGIWIGDTDYTPAPPNRRPTAMVFQNYALWPHMSVFDNVALGLKVRKFSRADIKRKVEDVVDLVGLTHHLRSRPGQISGGEQQRVALARALVLEPELLLLDEPLSNLDAKLRVRVREEIREIQKRSGITTVFVTHDQEEALSLADRIAVMNDGAIEQFDAPDTLYRSPATPFVARFVGTMNFAEGDLKSDGAGFAFIADDGSTVQVQSIDDAVGAASGRRLVGVRPEDVIIADPGADGSVVGARATIVRDIPLGHYREIVLRIGNAEFRAFTEPTRRWSSATVGVSFRRAVTFEAEGAAHV